MTEGNDPLLEAIAGLQIFTPDGNWEKRIRAQCHSQIARQPTREMQSARNNVHRLSLADIAALGFLFAYLSALLQEAARLGGFL